MTNPKQHTAADELYYQIHRLGGGCQFVSAIAAHNALCDLGHSRADSVAALNALIQDGSIEFHEGWTGLVETVRIARSS